MRDAIGMAEKILKRFFDGVFQLNQTMVRSQNDQRIGVDQIERRADLLGSEPTENSVVLRIVDLKPLMRGYEQMPIKETGKTRWRHFPMLRIAGQRRDWYPTNEFRCAERPIAFPQTDFSIPTGRHPSRIFRIERADRTKIFVFTNHT